MILVNISIRNTFFFYYIICIWNGVRFFRDIFPEINSIWWCELGMCWLLYSNVLYLSGWMVWTDSLQLENRSERVFWTIGSRARGTKNCIIFCFASWLDLRYILFMMCQFSWPLEGRNKILWKKSSFWTCCSNKFHFNFKLIRFSITKLMKYVFLPIGSEFISLRSKSEMREGGSRSIQFSIFYQSPETLLYWKILYYCEIFN